jgi:glyoxylase-like metal-dependent hydrolase (beta-lactamase superfamily II)
MMTRRGAISTVVFLTAFFLGNCLSFQLRAQQAGVLTNLEIGSYKTAIEYLRFPLDQPLSSSHFNYTATVSDQYTAKFYIAPTIPTGTEAEIQIDGSSVKSGEPYPVDLKEGVNHFTITVRSTQAPWTIYHLTVNREDLSKTYASEKLGNGIWRVYDFGGTRGDESFYLVEGADRALALDVGMGEGDLPAYLHTLTSKPIAVAITHGHGDHFGQVNEFKDSDVYISVKDPTRLPHDFLTPKFHYIGDGDVIDLGGGRKFEAINVPGHTLGSMFYLDRADGIAVTGDAISSGSMVYMFGGDCTALDEYVESLKHLEAKIVDVPNLTLLVGHSYQERTPLTAGAGRQMVDDMLSAAQKVLSGEMEGQPASVTRGGMKIELREVNVGLAGLWYNPKNLHTAPAALDLLDLRTEKGDFLIWKGVFASQRTEYTVSMPDQSTTVEVTPTAYWPNAKSIAVNGVAVKSGGTHAVELTSGTNKITIAVTGSDDSTRTYTVQIQE